MTQPCPFCLIVQGTGQAYKVYEDDTLVSFMDRRPIHPGHILVIPKQHVEDIYDLDDATYSHLMLTAKRLASVIRAITQPRKVGLVVTGLEVPHIHVHLIPIHHLYDITSRHLLEHTLTRPTEADLAGMLAQIVQALHGS